MKLLVIAMVMFSLSAFAGMVKSAQLDDSQENILVDVVYVGGCQEHKFTFKLNPTCLESMPVQCSGVMIESIQGGFDPCEALITKTVKVNLQKHNLTDSYFAGASLIISGDVGFDGQPTQAHVTLPR